MKAINYIWLITIVLFIIFCMPVIGQEDIQDSVDIKNENSKSRHLGNNAIYVTMGYAAGLVLNGSYERVLLQNPDLAFRAVFVRLGAGIINGHEVPSLFYTVDADYKLGIGTIGFLAGRKNSLFELGLGATFVDGTETIKYFWSNTTETRNYSEVLPAFTLGYRYQVPAESIVFRIGFGFPEIFYVSLGLSF